MKEFAARRATIFARRSLVAWFLLAIFVLFFAACSSSAPGTGSTIASTTESVAAVSGAPTAPCSLVTQAEVENALGKGATKTDFLNPRLGVHQCRLKPASTGAIEEVLIVVHTAEQWDSIKKAMLPPSSDARTVSGLGEDAFEGRAVGYNVRKGNKYVQVFGAVTNNDDANGKATRYLAERAASRL
ncbi:MAG TPA: hypothetical protein VKY85_15940 [Candidatus Angelobacter sp.]|nr:hypothetical protein [Candidatus Angelobacter sp.]